MEKEQFLEEIGQIAITSGWNPDEEIAATFSGQSDKEKRRFWGEAFLKRNAPRIQKVICSGKEPHPNTLATINVASFIAGVIMGDPEISIDPESAGRVIATYGITAFCKTDFHST